MKRRHSLAARGWMASAATGMLVIGPACYFAPMGWAQQPATAVHAQPRLLLNGAVNRELQSLQLGQGPVLNGPEIVPAGSFQPQASAPAPAGNGWKIPGLFDGTKSRPARPAATPAIKPMPPQQPQQQPQGQAQAPATAPRLPHMNDSSEVLKELEKLYAKNGQEMPNMSIEAHPASVQEAQENVRARNLQKPGTPAGNAQQVAAAASPAAHRPAPAPQQKPNFLQRLFGKKSSPPNVPQRPVVQPGQPAQQPVVHGGQPALQTLPGQNESHVAGAAESKAPQLPKLSPQTEPEVKTANQFDDLANPFPELPEIEADKAASPFTGLKLVEETPATPAETPGFKPIPDSFDQAEPQPEMKVAQPAAPQENSESVADTQPEDNPFEVKTAEQKPATPEVKTADVTQEETKQPAEEAPAARRPILTASSEEDTTRKTAPKYEEKLQKIAARDGMTGLKGFCPVALRDRRDLVDAKPEFTAEFEAKSYRFSSAEALAEFEANPAQYAPVKSGHDVVLLTDFSEEREGSLDYAVWYKQRLYLFSGEETLRTFSKDPSRYARSLGLLPAEGVEDSDK